MPKISLKKGFYCKAFKAESSLSILHISEDEKETLCGEKIKQRLLQKDCIEKNICFLCKTKRSFQESPISTIVMVNKDADKDADKDITIQDVTTGQRKKYEEKKAIEELEEEVKKWKDKYNEARKEHKIACDMWKISDDKRRELERQLNNKNAELMPVKQHQEMIEEFERENEILKEENRRLENSINEMFG